jgi:hypothetical protein
MLYNLPETLYQHLSLSGCATLQYTRVIRYCSSQRFAGTCSLLSCKKQTYCPLRHGAGVIVLKPALLIFRAEPTERNHENCVKRTMEMKIIFLLKRAPKDNFSEMVTAANSVKNSVHWHDFLSWHT